MDPVCSTAATMNRSITRSRTISRETAWHMLMSVCTSLKSICDPKSALLQHPLSDIHG